MQDGSDVTRMMTSVQSALARASRAGAAGVVYVAPSDDHEPVVGRLREEANIRLEFRSGSDRMVVGPVIRLVKKGLRRSLRWYLQPLMEQQSSFNHAVLDLVARLRLDNELLLNELDALRRAVPGYEFDAPPPGQLAQAVDEPDDPGLMLGD